MHLTCPHCQARVQNRDIDVGACLGICKNCHAVFTFAADGREPLARDQVSMPARFRVIDDDAPPPAGYRDNALRSPRLRIEWRWYTPNALFLVILAIIWNGLMVIWCFGTLGGGYLMMDLAGGASLAYAALARMLNRTTVAVEREALSIVHTPIPWFGVRIPVDDIDQLYCHRLVRDHEGVTSVAYSLHVTRKSTGASRVLLRSVAQPDEVLFLERRVEETLRIPDRTVAGEYRG